MHTRSQSRNSNRQQQQVPPTFVEPFDLEEPIKNPPNPPVVTMADNRTMAQLLEAPTEGYEDAIIVPEITADNFKLKHGLLTLVQNKQCFGHNKEDPHAHIRYFNKITSTIKFPNVLNSLNSAAGGNFLDKMHRDCLRIIKSKSKVRNSQNKAIVAKVSTSNSTLGISPDVAELKDMVKALLLDKKNQSQVPATLKVVEENYVTCGGAHYHRMDKSQIARKQSKTSKHGHENQKSSKRSQRIKAEARKAKPQSKSVKPQCPQFDQTATIDAWMIEEMIG
ncbi:hypothetical protein Tco_0038966 [Tanacetum coccineum]